MQGNAQQLRRSGKFRLPSKQSTVVKPTRTSELKTIMSPGSPYATPFRPMGSCSSVTDCAASTGTVIDLSALNQILEVNTQTHEVVCEPGALLSDIVNELSEQGFELACGHDSVCGTVGGAIAGGSGGPSFGSDGSLFSSLVKKLKVITPDGQAVSVFDNKQKLLRAFCLSYGMLGIIYEITLSIRPIRNFAVNNRRLTVPQFENAIESLAGTDVGLKFFLLPFRDMAYLELRYPGKDLKDSKSIPWKIKDWGETTILPNLVKSISAVMPISNVRYLLIDEASKLTQGVVNSQVSSGSNATAVYGKSKHRMGKGARYCTWFFPCRDFSLVTKAYVDFCHKIQSESGFRCDLPTEGFRIAQDHSALLSPSFEEPMIALRPVCTQRKGWADFLIDFADFARHWGGVPSFSQTKEVAANYPSQVLGNRLEAFRKIRRHFDADGRMMNPFLSQYFL